MDKYADLRDALPVLIEEARLKGGVNSRAQMIIDLLAERDRMRDALETIAVYPHARDQEMSTAAMRKIARAAIAQKQGGSDAT